MDRRAGQVRWPAELSRMRARPGGPATGRLAPTRAGRAVASIEAGRELGCAHVARQLPLAVDGTERLNPAATAHLSACPACQSELAGYRHLLDLLHSLRHDHLVAPRPLIGEEAWSVIAEQLRARARAGERWRVAGAAALTLAVLGGAAIARSALQGRGMAGATATA